MRGRFPGLAAFFEIIPMVFRVLGWELVGTEDPVASAKAAETQ